MARTALWVAIAIALVALVLWSTGLVSLRRGPEATATQEGSNASAPDTSETPDDLDSLGYVGAVKVRDEDRHKVGVVHYAPEESSGGLNLYTPCGWGPDYRKRGGKKPIREARLIDMQGKLLRTWTAEYPDDSEILRDNSRRGQRGWAFADFGNDGSLYAVHSGMGLLKLDWDSNLLWGRPEFYHHALTFDEQGNVVGLIDVERRVPLGEGTVSMLDNGVAFVSPEGKLLRIMWMYPALADDPRFQAVLRKKFGHRGRPRAGSNDDSDPDPSLVGEAFGDAAEFFHPEHRRRRRGKDVLHANSIVVLSQDSADRWKAGDIMSCLREIGMIVVFDRETGELKWSWGDGELDHPHDPTLLDNGHLLIFDNGMNRKASRVIEVDPATGRIAWTFEGTKKAPLFSRIRGQAQPLDNGNVLVVSSQEAHVLEVNRSSKIVWEFFGPDFVGNGYRVPLRMQRLQGDKLETIQRLLAGD
jgi:hypothetical protein